MQFSHLQNEFTLLDDYVFVCIVFLLYSFAYDCLV